MRSYYVELNDGTGADRSTQVHVDGELEAGTIVTDEDIPWQVIEADHELLFARAIPVDPLTYER